MSKEKHLQFIASFLIVLVLTIPFYITSTYAAINKVTVKGGDGIGGFARPNDFLSFNVQASMPNDTITNNQVILGSDIQFDSCIPSASSGFECTLRYPSNGTDSFEAKSVPFTISLFKDDKTLDDSKSGNITIDNKAPNVKLSSQPKFSSQQNVVVSYDVTDSACDNPTCNNKCVGLKSIEFYTLDGAFRQLIEPTKNATNECNAKSSVSIDTKTFNDGKNSVFAKAADKFNQISPETSVTFAIDKTSPSVISNSFAVMRRGVSISTFTHNAVPVEVFVNISGTDLNLNSVAADLSSLNPSQNLKGVKASCTPVRDDLHTCKWDIELSPAAGGLKTVVANASDNSGNKESASISKLLSLDDKGPVVHSLSTTTTQGIQAFAKSSGNTVIAVLDDATGLSADGILLHVDSREIKATGCSKAENWVCIWENVEFGSSSRMSIEADSTDILGNALSDESYVGVNVDSRAPALKSIGITAVGGIVQAFPGIFKVGDKIAIAASLTEDNDVLASADFSKFISGASKVIGSCERLQADEHQCRWLTDSINLQASDFITLNFSDNAGNTLIATRSLKTFGLENATVPDFWTNTVACSPSSIDRTLGPLINQRVFCEVGLTPKSLTKTISTVFIGQPNCVGGTSIVQSVEAFNTEAGSVSPVIKLTLRKDEFRSDKADLTCSFNIFSKIGAATTITRNPEIENAKINLRFSNLPLGEVSEEVKRKIQDAKDDAEGAWEIIGTLNKIVLWAKKICQIIGVIYNIVAAFYTMTHLLMSIDIAAQKAPILGLFTITPAAIAGCEAETNMRVAVAQPTKHALNKFCSFVNCKQTILWGPQVQNWINNAPVFIGPGQYLGQKTKVEGKGLFGQRVADTKELTMYDNIRDRPEVGFARPVSEYMDPRHNLITATLFVCLPGIIYGLDKFRQIKCLYADCLQNVAGKEVPVTACENLKDYATCKYVTGELFALFPWTAVFDHFMKLIKYSLSNPFAALGAAITVGCMLACKNPIAEVRLATWRACEFVKLFSQVGDIALDIKNLVLEGFKIRQDYCTRLDFDDNSKLDNSTLAKETASSSRFGLGKK